MILLSPKPNFLASLSWKNAACIPGRSTNCWPVEGFQPRDCSQRVVSFSEQTAWHEFWGAWQSLVSFTDFLVCVYVIKPGDAEQQLIHCLGEPGLARHTEDVLSGWRHCNWKYQAITTLRHQKLWTWSFPKQLDTTYLLATWFNLVTSTINHQARQIHVVSGSQESPCRCRPGAPQGTVKF